VLGSKDVALDGRHTPALYSRFLSSLLARYTSRNALDGLADDDVKTFSHYTDGRPLTSVPRYSWPDIDVGTQLSGNGGNWTGFGDSTQDNEADMDLSLSHFVRTVTQNFPGGVQREDPVGSDTWDGWDFGQVHWTPSSGVEWWGQNMRPGNGIL
jgi:transcriptional regulatory protein LEU3